MKFVLGFTAPSLGPFSLVGVFFTSMEPHPCGTSMLGRISGEAGWQDKQHISCTLLGREVSFMEALIPLPSRVSASHGVEAWLVGVYSSGEFSKPWTWIDYFFYDMNKKALVLLEVLVHLPEEMEHWAVTGDGGITTTICCLVHRWLFVVSTEQMESFAQMIVCNHVNETQGEHFRKNGTMKSSVRGPVDPSGIPWYMPVLLPKHSILLLCLLGCTWLTSSSFFIT